MEKTRIFIDRLLNIRSTHFRLQKERISQYIYTKILSSTKQTLQTPNNTVNKRKWKHYPPYIETFVYHKQKNLKIWKHCLL